MAIESPLWTPARSTCSIIPGMSTDSPSQTASTSISLPSKYLSISTRRPSPAANALEMNLISSVGLRTISIALPPST